MPRPTKREVRHDDFPQEARWSGGSVASFAAALTLSSAVNASVPETSDAESCCVAVIGAGAAGLAAAIAAKEAGAVRVVVLEKQHLRAAT